jgi:hypothetical protein
VVTGGGIAVGSALPPRGVFVLKGMDVNTLLWFTIHISYLIRYMEDK